MKNTPKTVPEKYHQVWELYIFPGGKVGQRQTKFGVRLWMWLNCWRISELRAINKITKEHIVR
jgi:hypothetical protein